jgi:hemolysin activation/secretion protein
MWVDRPLIRGLDANVSVQLQADVNQLKDHIDSASLRTDRTISSISLTIMGDQINNYGRGGVSSWRLGLKTGILSFDDIAAKTADAGSANTVGHFKKINLNINFLQSVAARSSIYLEAKGQWASNNLDSSEKLVAGGVHAVRGYNSGSLSGDIGHVGTVEFRYYLRQAFDGRLTGSLFYDTAHIMVNNNPWEGLVDGNSSTINSVGVALDWVGPAQSSASFALAAPTASKSALVSNKTSYTIRFKMKREF